MEVYDADADVSLGFEEFVTFLDMEFATLDSLDDIEKIVSGFMQIIERGKAARVAMWQSRASMVDHISRWTLPFGFFVFMARLFLLDEVTLQELSESGAMRNFFYFSSTMPLCVGCLVVAIFFSRSHDKSLKECKDSHAQQPRGSVLRRNVHSFISNSCSFKSISFKSTSSASKCSKVDVSPVPAASSDSEWADPVLKLPVYADSTPEGSTIPGFCAEGSAS
jgi:hypothetical protein